MGGKQLRSTMKTTRSSRLSQIRAEFRRAFRTPRLKKLMRAYWKSRMNASSAMAPTSRGPRRTRKPVKSSGR